MTASLTILGSLVRDLDSSALSKPGRLGFDPSEFGLERIEKSLAKLTQAAEQMKAKLEHELQVSDLVFTVGSILLKRHKSEKRLA